MVSVNFVAKRFEILDSLRGDANVEMIEHANQLVEAIKRMYRVNYSNSRRQIDSFELMYIPVPKQNNGLVFFSYVLSFLAFDISVIHITSLLTFFLFFRTDCGFFMLKFLELWNGSVVPAIFQDHIPGLKIKLTSMWLQHPRNELLNWRSLLEENMF
jgi:hypothetical protein